MLFRKLKPNYETDKNTIHLIGLSCNSIPPKKYGGIELIISNLAKGFTKNGQRVRVYSPGTMTIEGCEHSRTLPEPTQSIQVSSIANTKEHLSKIESEMRLNCKPGDVVIFNHSDHYRYLKKKLGRIFFSRLNTYEIAHWMDAGLYRNIIYPSKALQVLLKKDGHVIPHGEDLIFSEENNASRSQDLFYAGRITKDKGVDIALEACNTLGCKLRIAAPFAYTNFFNDVVNHKNVMYLGELTYQELFLEYQKAKAFIYMTQYEEPFGLAIIEAMAAGCPVITTGKGGSGETVIENQTGFFCNNIDDIVNAYENTENLKHSDIVSQSKKYTVEAMVSKYDQLIRKGKVND